SQYIHVPNGRMHYVDEGDGETIMMLHGTPMWSFLYRHLISGLSDQYRVVAPAHLGFGLSDKPQNYSYRPEQQARNIAAFIRQLNLQDITLVVHDFGGPIGLSYALDHPENIRRLVIFNTWLWPLQDDPQMAVVGRLLSSPLGRWLFLRFNFEVNVITPSAFGDRAKLTRAVHDQYREPLRDPMARQAVWVYARELLGSRDWYKSLWERRDVLQDIPKLILWGKKDPVLRPTYLDHWLAAFPNAQKVTYPDTGHYVQEEQGPALVPTIRQFLA
ncbi:MAG: alpha/beta fold hydrolase, partial [Chloroflexi bacterium]|nr:alpha/beta fold hydrolase [Chloroflexota bacterium]